jgi:hypothetical protein
MAKSIILIGAGIFRQRNQDSVSSVAPIPFDLKCPQTRCRNIT